MLNWYTVSVAMQSAHRLKCLLLKSYFLMQHYCMRILWMGSLQSMQVHESLLCLKVCSDTAQREYEWLQKCITRVENETSKREVSCSSYILWHDSFVYILPPQTQTI